MGFRRGRNRKPREAAGGFSLVLTMASLAVLAVGLVATLGSTTNAMRGSRALTDVETARRALSARIELLKATPFADVLASFDDDPSNDPGGAGKAPGRFFTVDELEPLPNSDATQMGWVEFPTVEVGGKLELREDVELPDLGMPRDLSGDGNVDGLDHWNDRELIPVAVHLSWASVDGASPLRATLLLAPR